MKPVNVTIIINNVLLMCKLTLSQGTLHSTVVLQMLSIELNELLPHGMCS